MKKIILYLCIGYLTLACEDVIELELNTAAPRLAIDAQLKVNPNEQFTQLIKLSLTSGFYELDSLTQGFQKSDLILVTSW